MHDLPPVDFAAGSAVPLAALDELNAGLYQSLTSS